MISKRSLLTFVKQLFIPLTLGLAVLYVLAQANPLAGLPGLDSGNYLYVARQLLKGKLLYVDVWNHKTFAGYYLDAFGLLLSNGNRWGIWLIEFVFLFTSTFIGFTIAARQWGKAAASFATLFWLFYLNITLQNGNLTEEYSLLFNFLALLHFWNWQKTERFNGWRWLLFGILTGVNFFIRPNNIGISIAVALTVLVLSLLQRNFKQLLNIGLASFAGFALVVSAALLFFYANGNLTQMLESSLLYNFYYTGENFDSMVMLKNGIRIFQWGLMVPLAGYAALVWAAIKKQASPWMILGLIALPLEIWLSSLSGRGYTHYFMTWLPVFWLLSGSAFATFSPSLLSDKLLSFLQRYPATLFLLFALFNFQALGEKAQIYALSVDRLLFNRGAGVQMVNPISEYLQQHTSEDETVFIWGADAGINFLAERDAPTAFLRYPLMIDSPITQDMAGRFFQDLQANQPTYIVDLYSRNYDNILSLNGSIRQDQLASGKPFNGVPANIDAVLAYINENYKMEKSIGKINIYRLRP